MDIFNRLFLGLIVATSLVASHGEAMQPRYEIQSIEPNQLHGHYTGNYKGSWFPPWGDNTVVFHIWLRANKFPGGGDLLFQHPDFGSCETEQSDFENDRYYGYNLILNDDEPDILDGRGQYKSVVSLEATVRCGKQPKSLNAIDAGKDSVSNVRWYRFRLEMEPNPRLDGSLITSGFYLRDIENRTDVLEKSHLKIQKTNLSAQFE